MNNEEINNIENITDNEMIDNQEPINNSIEEPNKKKSKKWIFIIIGIILLLILYFFIIKPLFFGNKDNSKIIEIKENMSNKLDNFSYNSIITINLYGTTFNVDIKCKEDNKNSLGYCSINNNLVNIEEYMDYKNKIKYTKTDALTDSKTDWTKTEDKDMSSSTPILKTMDSLTIEKEEKQDNGTLYTGYMNGKSMSNVINIAKKSIPGNINITKFFKKKIPVTLFVNNDNYVEKLSFSIKII